MELQQRDQERCRETDSTGKVIETGREKARARESDGICIYRYISKKKMKKKTQQNRSKAGFLNSKRKEEEEMDIKKVTTMSRRNRSHT